MAVGAPEAGVAAGLGPYKVLHLFTVGPLPSARIACGSRGQVDMSDVEARSTANRQKLDDLPLTPDNMKTWYVPGPTGYTDYPRYQAGEA